MAETDTIRWDIIPIDALKTPAERKIAHRLNCYGSLYYFLKVVLRRRRLYDPLHSLYCSYVERQHLKEVIECPRDHFKTTVYSEGAPMWWALPFNDQDAMYMERLGYPPEWIKWMKWAHNQDTRTLIVSENKENINKIGSRIRWHYENNDFFRDIFPETQPDASCTWGATSLMHKRTKKSPDGEGTYDFLSVGSALQSRHYERVIEDDLVGRDAINSDVIMRDTIDYHRLLPGAFDSSPELSEKENDEIVVGNRWSSKDLNAWIKENEPNFHFVTHSALGGCCNLHPAGQPILPTEWSKQKLEGLIPRYGLYYYSCQYLNNPIAEGVALFDKNWLRYYDLRAFSDTDRRARIVHEVQEGEIKKDVNPTHDLAIFMVVDPNHAGNQGRCRHAITVQGVLKKKGPNGEEILRIYLLDSWAEACHYKKFVDKIYQVADYWRLSRFWLETVGGQQWLKFYLDERNKVERRKLKVMPLKVDTSANAKAKRIEAMNPYFAEGQVWIRRTAHQDFVTEYGSYPNGRTVDILDTFAYGPQVWDGRCETKDDIMTFLGRQQQNYPLANVGIAGY